MVRQYKSYEEDFKKTVVKLYENGRSIIVKKYNHTAKSITDNTKDYSNLLN